MGCKINKSSENFDEDFFTFIKVKKYYDSFKTAKINYSLILSRLTLSI